MPSIVHHLFYDGNGNVTSLRDDAGNLSCEYTYGPFGETLTACGSDAALANNAFKFSTKYVDAESGLLYYGYRYYNPGTGRWLNRDPIEEAGGTNLLGFVGNDPGNYFDPLGHKRVIIALNGAGTSSFGSIPVMRYWKEFIKRRTSDFEWIEAWHDGGSGAVNRAMPHLTSPNDDCNYNTLIILGYSWVAHSAVKFTSDLLRTKGVKVDLVFVADPVRGVIHWGSFRKNLNVSRLVNFYQRVHSTRIGPISGSRFRGTPVSGADVNTELMASDFDPSMFEFARGNLFTDAPGANMPAERIVADAHIYIGIHDLVLAWLTSEVNGIPEGRSDYEYP
jgi:RHS repeat-associated protein